MRPKSSDEEKQPKKTWDMCELEEERKTDKDINKRLFPVLAMANDPGVRVSLL